MDPILVAGIASFIAVAALSVLAIRQIQQRSQKYTKEFEAQATRKLQSQFLYIDANNLVSAKLVLIVFAMAASWFIWESLVLVLIAALVAGLLPVWWLKRMQVARRKAFRNQLPDVLMLLAGNLRAGSGLSQAMEQMTREMPMPAKQEFTLVLRELRLGTSLMNALSSMERRMPLEELSLVIAAARIATENGANLAEAFEVLADTLRNKMAIEDKISALTAQGRMQAWVISAMPLLVMFMLSQIQPDSMHPLYHTYLGWAALFLVFLFEICGLLMIRRIVAIEI